MKIDGTVFVNTNNLSVDISTASLYDPWNYPVLVGVNDSAESIEFIYKQVSQVTLCSWPHQSPDERVFKIAFSCVEGRWNKSEPIYGKIVPASNEYYTF